MLTGLEPSGLKGKEHWGLEAGDVSTQASKGPPVTPLSDITFLEFNVIFSPVRNSYIS